MRAPILGVNGLNDPHSSTDGASSLHTHPRPLLACKEEAMSMTLSQEERREDERADRASTVLDDSRLFWRFVHALDVLDWKIVPQSPECSGKCFPVPWSSKRKDWPELVGRLPPKAITGAAVDRRRQERPPTPNYWRGRGCSEVPRFWAPTAHARSNFSNEDLGCR